jgi:hypothetical protein
MAGKLLRSAFNPMGGGIIFRTSQAIEFKIPKSCYFQQYLGISYI